MPKSKSSPLPNDKPHYNLLAEVDDFIREMDCARSAQDVYLILRENIEDLGFERFSYQVIEAPTGQQKKFYISTYPEEWIRHYNKERYISHDILGRITVRTFRPFDWSEAGPISKFTPMQQKLILEARELGLRSGAMVPIHGPGPIRALLAVTSSICEEEFANLFAEKRHALHLIATYAHERLIQMGFHEGLPRTLKLSAREIEVLTWAADGFTYDEIAEKLSISSETVRTHTNSAMQKLGACNKTQAIAVALLYGLILPKASPETY